ncbi:unnamed protein product, partial [Timema podura]|nr:unnamed protein product [Timema podura]
KEAEAENELRLRTIQQVCHRYNLGLYKHSAELPSVKHPPTPQYKHTRLSWCPIYKAASTTFLYNFLILGGYTEQFLATTNKQLSDLARKVYPELEYSEAEQHRVLLPVRVNPSSVVKLNTTGALANYATEAGVRMLTLNYNIFVRHPFERLLSAYRDKLENVQVGHEHGTWHYYRKYGRRIVKKYRQGGNLTKTWTILSQDQYYWPPDKTRPAGIEPTFQEFVRYLIDMDIVLYSDDHWIPYYLYCTPCLLKYDIIAKVESLLRDQVYVIRSAVALRVSHSLLIGSDGMKPRSGDWAVTIDVLQEGPITSFVRSAVGIANSIVVKNDNRTRFLSSLVVEHWQH